MRKETLLGLLVLGAVGAGAFWARPPSPSAGGSPTLPEGQGAPSPGAPAAARDGGDSTIPDVTRADGAVDVGDVRVILSVLPRPPVAFTKERFRVRVVSDGAPRVLEGGRISFEMTMPMGDHRYTLVAGESGWYEAEVVLPFCKSGNPRWYALVEGTVARRRLIARFRLDLTKPASPPP